MKQYALAIKVVLHAGAEERECMNRSGKLALVVCMSAMLGAVNCTGALAADAAFGADIENWTEEDWRSVAMADDSKVMTGVVIREAASKKSRAAGYFYPGAAAAVVNKGEEWTEIRSGSVQGFVKNRYLVFGEEAKEAALRYGTRGVTANWDEVYVFEQADADSNIMGTLGEGYKMELLADDGHWLTVKKGAEDSVYVSSEDVSKVLLLDTAVPADGESVQAASAVWHDEGSRASGEARNSQDSAPAEEVYDAGAAEAVSTGSEEYHEDAVQASYAEQEYYDSGAEAADSTYEDSESSYSADQNMAVAKVSDDAHVQYLYETYVEAQDAAMNPVSDEDAQIKADAAVAAYQNYVDAANGTDSGSSDSYDSSYSSDSYESSDSSGSDVYVLDSSYEDSSSDSYSTESYSTESYSTDSYSTESYSNSYGDYSDLDLLAAIIYCEAGNQCYDGKVAVGAVVMNRVKSSSFPNTVAEVLDQAGQFSPASSGRLQNAIANGIPSECYSAAQDALNGVDPVPGALYFNTSSGTTKLGDHYFS